VIKLLVGQVVHVMAPNMNPQRSNCLRGDYTKGDRLLGQCYSSLLSTFWDIASGRQQSPPPKKSRAEKEEEEEEEEIEDFDEADFEQKKKKPPRPASTYSTFFLFLFLFFLLIIINMNMRQDGDEEAGRQRVQHADDRQ
jgi:hypothetical protein